MYYKVYLRDGRTFVGYRRWWWGFFEGWFNTRYRVVSIDTLPLKGCLVNFNARSILCWVRIPAADYTAEIVTDIETREQKGKGHV